MSKAHTQTQNKAIGEVLSSSVTGIVAQCWNIHDDDGMPTVIKPRFGSFLKIDSSESGLTIYAVLYNVNTGPRDNVHRPSALGMTREQLKSEQPHIFSLLHTELHAVTIGFKQFGIVNHHLPPLSPDVHDFVYPATDEEIEAITNEFDFLRLLTTISAVPTDELLAATVREAYAARDNDYDFLIAAGQALSHLLRSDYDRLMCVLRKIRPIETS